MNKLTPKQERFCKEYIIDLNGTQAAIRAGYSKKTANEQGAQLLAKLSIQDKIKELQNIINTKLELNAEWIINELMSNHEMAKSLKKLSDSNKALELLGRHLGMFTDNFNVSSNELKNIFNKLRNDNDNPRRTEYLERLANGEDAKTVLMEYQRNKENM